MTGAYHLLDILLTLIHVIRPDDGCVDVAEAEKNAATMGQKLKEMQKNEDQ